MEFESCYQVGYVIKRHGLKGDVKILLDKPLPKKLESIFVDIDNRLVPFFIDHLSIQNDLVIVKFEDVSTPDQADQLVKRGLFLPLSVKPKSKSKNAELTDLIGFSVVFKSQTLGKVSSINEHALNPLLIIPNEEKEILIPINEYFIKDIDHKNRSIEVDLPEGFLDI